MINIKINDFEFLVKPHISILEACKYAGINIPRFCYHETLSVSGNCRMCLVEIEGLEKPLASCVAEVDEGMSIWVDTPFVKKARENVTETLLLNHPLDCPICDQAGECDLQDQIKSFGSPYSRFFFKKKSTEDKYCGPLIKTIMTRCITCTRCVRYASEVAGVDFFGTINRGSGTEIGAYVSKMFNSEISGNVIDLCPVGALTSRPYAFKVRPWELRLVESIDTTDSLGSNIYVNSKGTEIFRVLPKSNIEINNTLISDKARFSYDANNLNRLKDLFSYSKLKNKFEKLSWKNFLKINEINLKLLKPITVVIDEKCDLQTGILLKKIVNKKPSFINIVSLLKTNSKGNFYNASQMHIIDTINNSGELVVFLGTNLRLENAVLNAIIRLKYKNTVSKFISSGLHFNENIPTTFLNLNTASILAAFEGKSLFISKLLINAKAPLLFISENFADRIDNLDNFIKTIQTSIPTLKVININTTMNSEGLRYLGLQQSSINRNLTSVFGFNLEDNLITRKLLIHTNNFIWLNTHGSKLATKFNNIIPTLTSFESEQILLNLEARVQKTSLSFISPFKAETPFNSFKALFNICDCDLNNTKENYYSFIIEQLQNVDLYKSLKLTKSPATHIINTISASKLVNSYSSVNRYPIKQKLKDFYCTNTFTKTSLVMQECSIEIKKNSTNFY